MAPYYTYIPPPQAAKPKSLEPRKTSYYNYHPPYAGRLTDAYPPCYYAYMPVAHVHTPNVPKHMLSNYYVNLHFTPQIFMI